MPSSTKFNESYSSNKHSIESLYQVLIINTKQFIDKFALIFTKELQVV